MLSVAYSPFTHIRPACSRQAHRRSPLYVDEQASRKSAAADVGADTGPARGAGTSVLYPTQYAAGIASI